MTAFGCFQGIKAALKHAGLGERLEGVKVAVQGVGNVGYHLCSYLSAAGAKLIITDIYPNQVEKVVQEFDATVVTPDQSMRSIATSSLLALWVPFSTNAPFPVEVQNRGRLRQQPVGK